MSYRTGCVICGHEVIGGWPFARPRPPVMLVVTACVVRVLTMSGLAVEALSVGRLVLSSAGGREPLNLRAGPVANRDVISL